MLVGYSMSGSRYRPLRGAPRLAPLITAIGVSILLQHLAMLVWSRNVLAFPQIIDNTSYTLGGASITNVQIAIIAVCVALMGGLALPRVSHAAWHRDARHRARPARRRADGGRRQPRHRRNLRHRRRARRRRRRCCTAPTTASPSTPWARSSA